VIGHSGGVTPSAVARAFRIVAVAEACSWAGLLVGMLFKWILRVSEIGVTVFGPIHGALFVAYVVIALLAARTFRWSVSTTLVALAVSIPPMATLWFERRARRSAQLSPASAR
jgi:integral membrane protein